MSANDTDSIGTAEALYSDVVKLVKEIALYARVKDLDKAQSLFDEITEAITRNPEHPGFREMKAGVAVPLSAAYGNAGFIEKVRSIYNEIKAMAEEFPSELNLREYQSNIAVNLSIDYMNRNQLDAV